MQTKIQMAHCSDISTNTKPADNLLNCIVKPFILLFARVLQLILIEAPHYEINEFAVALKLFDNHDGLLIHRSFKCDLAANGTTLDVEICGNVHAVTWEQSGLAPVDLFDQGILVGARVEEVDRRFLVVMLVKHINIQILFVNR